jgi:hypothetical protein
MSKQTINIGASPNDGTGTPLRTSFDYCNLNFTELYTATGPSGNDIVVPGNATITGDLTVDTSTLKVDSTNHRVGIGTATPGFPLDVKSATAVFKLESTTGTNAAYLYATSTGGDFYFGRDNSTGTTFSTGTGYSAVVYSANAYPMVFFTNAAERYRIDSTGVATWSVAGSTAMTLNSTGLGVGVAPTDKLTLQSTTDCAISLAKTTGTNKLYIITDGTTGFLGSTAGSTGKKIAYSLTCPDNSLTLDASGNLLVKKTTLSASTLGCELTASGQINGATANLDNLNIFNTTAGLYRFYVSGAGTVNATSATISAISDARLKENVKDIDVGLAAILALKPRKFDWKAGKGKDIKGDRGFIAQEFETVFPNLVDEWKDPAPEGEAPYKSVRQDLIPVLVKAIQELTARVAALEA